MQNDRIVSKIIKWIIKSYIMFGVIQTIMFFTICNKIIYHDIDLSHKQT